MSNKRPATLIGIRANNGVSLEENFEVMAQIALEDNAMLCKTMDSTIGKGYKSASTVGAPKMISNTINGRHRERQKTIADLAADNPLIAALLKAGL